MIGDMELLECMVNRETIAGNLPDARLHARMLRNAWSFLARHSHLKMTGALLHPMGKPMAPRCAEAMPCKLSSVGARPGDYT